jgi:hypothetical protein
MQYVLTESNPDHYFVPPYVGRHGWIGLRLDRGAEWSEIAGVLQDAYLSKAPKKYRKLIAGSGEAALAKTNQPRTPASQD